MEVIFTSLLFFSTFDPVVHCEIAKLGHESFFVRQKATEKLAKMGTRPVTLLRFAERDRDPEVRTRARRLLEGYYSSIKPSKSQTFPWIECLPKDYPDRDEVLKKCFESYGEPYYAGGDELEQEAEKYRYATQSLALSLLKSGKSKEYVVDILDRMVENEEQWVQCGGRGCFPPDFNR